METNESKRDFKEVWTVVEGKDGKDHWQKLGAAFENRDGSQTILLNAMPFDGKLIVRERRAFEDRNRGLGLIRVHGRDRADG